MDEVTLIVSALTAGAVAGAKDAATAAVGDAYESLRDLVRHWLVGKPNSEEVVTALDSGNEPALWQDRLTVALTESDAAQAPDAVAAAQRLMALLDPEGTRAGKYIIDMHDAEGVQVNVHARASSRGRIYQVGQGTQNITER
jgi:hypothetical protein